MKNPRRNMTCSAATGLLLFSAASLAQVPSLPLIGGLAGPGLPVDILGGGALTLPTLPGASNGASPLAGLPLGMMGTGGGLDLAGLADASALNALLPSLNMAGAGGLGGGLGAGGLSGFGGFGGFGGGVNGLLLGPIASTPLAPAALPLSFALLPLTAQLPL